MLMPRQPTLPEPDGGFRRMESIVFLSSTLLVLIYIYIYIVGRGSSAHSPNELGRAAKMREGADSQGNPSTAKETVA